MASASFTLCDSSARIIDDIESVSCSVCLEIFEKPVTISCGHTFCNKCISDCYDLAEPQCPLCRATFDPSKRQKASDLEKKILGCKGICQGCSKKMGLCKLRSHHDSCTKLKTQIKSHKFSPVANTSQPIPDVPNRHTFKCPYCGLKNLDTLGLVKHCNDNHSGSPAKVVCPICAAMPWGNANQKSANFIQHLNLRHRFEYDTFVDFAIDEDSALAGLQLSSDYAIDDDTALQAALRASLQEL